MSKIIPALAALLDASYLDEGPTDLKRDLWRGVAADARAEYDALRAQAEEVERLRAELHEALRCDCDTCPMHTGRCPFCNARGGERAALSPSPEPAHPEPSPTKEGP